MQEPPPRKFPTVSHTAAAHPRVGPFSASIRPSVPAVFRHAIACIHTRPLKPRSDRGRREQHPHLTVKDVRCPNSFSTER
jgi:hypothetical protein